MKIAVLETTSTDRGDVSWSALGDIPNVEIEFFDHTEPFELEERGKGVSLLIVNKLRVGDKELEILPACKAIFLLATGYDNVDIDACTRRGIFLYNVSDYSSASVAQHALAMIMDRVNRVRYYDRCVQQGVWSAVRNSFCYYDHGWREMGSLVLGVVGMGSIGATVARYALALGMRVLAHVRDVSKYRRRYEDIAGIDFVSIDELLGQADFVSLHVPLTDDTRGMVDQSFLDRMKAGSTLINTSRGAIVDECDLADWLHARPSCAAYLDVLSVEPPPSDHPLIGLSNCVLTPHMSWTSMDSRQRLVDMLAANVEDYIFNEAKKSLNYSDIVADLKT